MNLIEKIILFFLKLFPRWHKKYLLYIISKHWNIIFGEADKLFEKFIENLAIAIKEKI